jgi:hypothetical protein
MNTKSKTKTTLTFRHKPSGKFLCLAAHAALLVDYKDWRIPSFGIHQRVQMGFILKGYADRGTLPTGTTESEYEIVQEKITTVVIREIVSPAKKTP